MSAFYADIFILSKTSPRGYRVGGKTGTTTKTTVEAETGAKEYMVSFCAVAPTDDPEVVCLLILDNPSKDTGIYISGGQMAAPVVGQILSEVLPYLGVEPIYTEEEMQYINVSMPYVKNMSVEEATAAIEDAAAEDMTAENFNSAESIMELIESYR